MKRPHLITIFAACIAATLYCGCRPSSYKELEPETVWHTIRTLDSIVSTLYGFEPAENPGMEVPGMGLVPQEPYDLARQTWSDFRKECLDGDFEKAYHIITEVDNGADWLIYLKQSDLRCRFIANILRPMIYEFENIDIADSIYLNIVELEYSLEVYSIKYRPDSSVYVPESLPEVINALAVLKTQQGRTDEVMDLLDVYTYAVDQIYENDIVSQFMKTHLVADITLAAGYPEDAIKYWEDYKASIQEVMYDESDTIAYMRSLEMADEEIGKLKQFKDQ